MKARSRFLPLAMLMLAAWAVPREAVSAERVKQPAGKTPAAKQKLDLDMAILKDLEKDGVTMTEVPGNDPGKLGKLEIPFLGFVSVYSKTYILQAKELGFTDQRWALHWTSKGAFLGADFKRAGFSTKWNTGDVEDDYRAVGDCIVGLTAAPAMLSFGTLLKNSAGSNAPIDQIRIRRVLLKNDEGFGKITTAETYAVTIHSKGIMRSASGDIKWDSARILFDKDGKRIVQVNGL